MLASLPIIRPDALFALAAAVRQDPRPQRIDLVLGVYRDDEGQTPTLGVVQAVEARLAAEDASKAYRSPAGRADFNTGMARLLLGNNPTRLARQTTIQTVGGTGALRLLAGLVALATPDATVWSTDPGYANHRPLMMAAGLRVAPYRWREAGPVLDLDAVLDDLARAKKGDVVLLHGCCHNPTGIDMPVEGWSAVAELCAARGLVPLVDIAYQGFGDGVEADAWGLRYLVDRLETVLVAASCSKNMGLYCERTGAAIVLGADAAMLGPVTRTLEHLARGSYSTPPDHGAAIAAQLLAKPEPWLAELELMRCRVAGIRAALAEALVQTGLPARFESLGRQKGMFSLLPVGPEEMARLRREYAIYGTDEGRINLAGLRLDQIPYLAGALAEVAGKPLARERRAVGSARIL